MDYVFGWLVAGAAELLLYTILGVWFGLRPHHLSDAILRLVMRLIGRTADDTQERRRQ